MQVQLPANEQYKYLLFNHKGFMSRPKDQRMLMLSRLIMPSKYRNILETLYNSYMLDGPNTIKSLSVVYYLGRYSRTEIRDKNMYSFIPITREIVAVILKLGSTRLLKTLTQYYPSIWIHLFELSREMATVYVDSIHIPKYTAGAGCWTVGRCPPNLLEYPDLAQIYLRKIKAIDEYTSGWTPTFITPDDMLAIVYDWSKRKMSLREMWDKNVFDYPGGLAMGEKAIFKLFNAGL